MALDKIMIGTRIRKIREDILGETRLAFAQRCDLTESHVAQIERGQYLLSLTALDHIVSSTGTDINYILYGIEKGKKLTITNNLHNMIDMTDEKEQKMYYKCICAIKSYINKNIIEKEQ